MHVVLIRSVSDSDLTSFTNFVLPMGLPENDYIVNLNLHCYDKYGSVAIIPMTAEVEPKNEPIAKVS